MSRRPSTLLRRLTSPALLLAAVLLGASLAAWLDRQGYISLAHDLNPEPFRDGDIVCFLGDSITEDGRFIAYLNAFYLTRFPDRRIHFVNTGIPGETVGDARRRIAWDVLAHSPTTISFMFGMNDVGRHFYDPANTAPDLPDRRARALDNFEWNLDFLSTQLAAHPAPPSLLFVTPSPYDETAELEAPSFPGINRALARMRPILARLARKHRGHLIDLHAPLTALSADVQASSPTTTVIGPDRIHPEAAGHLLIACHFLLAQNVPTTVSDFALDPATGKITRALNGRITQVAATDDRLSFTCEEFALPFPIDPPARIALAWFPVHEQLNRQSLTVSFDESDDSTYRLLIDGETIADFSADDLREGVNLAPLTHTPQSRQAHALLKILEERRQIEIQVRRLAHVRALLENARLDPDDDAAIETFFADRVSGLQGSQAQYFESLFADYRILRHAAETLSSELARLTDLLRPANQPIPHRYEFIRLAADVSEKLTPSTSDAD